MIKKVEHVGIMAIDMEVSVEFYVDLLGFVVEEEVNTYDKKIVFLVHSGLPGFSIELIADINSSISYSNKGLVNHLAFAVDDFDKVVKELKTRGVAFERESPKFGRNGRKTIRFRGPSGETLQLVEVQS